MTIQLRFLPNSYDLPSKSIPAFDGSLMRNLQFLNDTRRRVVSAAALPQEDWESMDTAAFLIHSSATFLMRTSGERICQSKHPPGCLLEARLWDWL